MTWEYKTLSVADLKPATYNPREISKDEFEGLRESLKTFGFADPAVVNSNNNVIVGGHQRIKAWEALGNKDVPCMLAPLTEEQEKKLNIVLNSQAISGRYDELMLSELLEGMKLDEDYESLRLDKLEPLDLSDTEVEEDEAPEVSKEEPKSELGKVYQLGRHRVMCGDGTSLEDITKLMDGVKADMVFTDPPYNVDYVGKTKDELKIKNDKFTDQEFYQFLYDSISTLRPFVKGDVYICMSSSELHTLQKAFTDCGGHWSTFIIWVKHTFALGRSNYHRQYEPILYGWFDGSSHHWSGSRKLADVYKDEIQEDVAGRPMLYADGLNTDVWEFDKPSKNKEHPTMKPIALVARGVVNSSKTKGIVLDTFSGSGSTLIACEQTNRTCYGMELDPKYVDVIRKRYAKFTNNNELPDDWEELTKEVS